MTHVSDTTTSEALLALRPTPPLPLPPIDILVARTPPPRINIEDVLTEVRENRVRLDERLAGLEKTVHDNHVELTKRMDESDRRINGRFDEIKRWADAMATNQQLFMAEMKVSHHSLVIGNNDTPRLMYSIRHWSLSRWPGDDSWVTRSSGNETRNEMK